MKMKILFAKLIDDAKSARISYSLEGFCNTNEFLEKYELVFDDVEGFCYASSFSQEELTNKDCTFNIKKFFDIDVNILKEVTIVFFADTPSGTLLEGWYKDAEVYKYIQQISPMTRAYNMKTKSINAIYLPLEIKVPCEVEFKDFIVPTEKQSKKIVEFIRNYTGNSLNIVIENELKTIRIKDNFRIQQLIDKCKVVYKTDEFGPEDVLNYIKIFESSEKYGLSSDVCSLLGESYDILGQVNQALKYYKLSYELKPCYETKLNYATSLHFSNSWTKDITIFQELLNESESDLVRSFLADSYLAKGFLHDAYKLYDEITCDELLDRKKQIMNLIKTWLPNIASKKNYEIGKKILEMREIPVYLPIELMTLPQIQIMKGKEYYLDPIRKKPILKTIEEEVRQKTIRYLIDKIKVPKENILVEESFSHIDKSLKNRLDILVFVEGEDFRKNLLIVECKEPNTPVTGEALRQILQYNYHYAAKYLLVTNGNQSLIYNYSEINGNYLSCSTLPSFEEMNKKGNNKFIKTETIEFIRPDRHMIETPEYLDNGVYNWIIGDQSSMLIKVLGLNLYYSLKDESERLKSEINGYGCTIIKDNGITSRKCGNPAGGFYGDVLRWFEVYDRNRHIQNVYIGIIGWPTIENDPVNGNHKGKTVIGTAVEHKGKALSILQINLDTSTIQENEITKIYHNGKRSRKKKSTTLDFIIKHCPQLVDDDKIYLGCLDNSVNLSINGENEQEFLVRLISYTLLRYELRELELSDASLKA